MRDRSRRVSLHFALVLTLMLYALTAPAGAAVKPRLVLVVPFDATELAADDRWIGEGIVQTLSLGLTQHPAFIQVERARLNA
ncbi:MAG: hypothetical protein HY728_09085, partial [Candidatus Rokubacteria bacterium]|nr:hypothetical protein [Candidatus Rokubacteria bacterium]